MKEKPLVSLWIWLTCLKVIGTLDFSSDSLSIPFEQINLSEDVILFKLK